MRLLIAFVLVLLAHAAMGYAPEAAGCNGCPAKSSRGADLECCTDNECMYGSTWVKVESPSSDGPECRSSMSGEAIAAIVTACVLGAGLVAALAYSCVWKPTGWCSFCVTGGVCSSAPPPPLHRRLLGTRLGPILEASVLLISGVGFVASFASYEWLRANDDVYEAESPKGTPVGTDNADDLVRVGIFNVLFNGVLLSFEDARNLNPSYQAEWNRISGACILAGIVGLAVAIPALLAVLACTVARAARTQRGKGRCLKLNRCGLALFPLSIMLMGVLIGLFGVGARVSSTAVLEPGTSLIAALALGPVFVIVIAGIRGMTSLQLYDELDETQSSGSSYEYAYEYH